MNNFFLLLMTFVLASVARAESLCDMQIVSQILEARYGQAVIEQDASQVVFNIYNQPTFKVVVVIGPPEGRPWATDIYFVTKKTTFTKAEAQKITEIIAELPGTYFKETSAIQIHFGLQSYY